MGGLQSNEKQRKAVRRSTCKGW